MIQTKKQSLASVTFSSAISVSRSSGNPMDEYSWNADVPGKTLETKKDYTKKRKQHGESVGARRQGITTIAMTM